jgi:hypothetical protein
MRANAKALPFRSELWVRGHLGREKLLVRLDAFGQLLGISAMKIVIGQGLSTFKSGLYIDRLALEREP